MTLASSVATGAPATASPAFAPAARLSARQACARLRFATAHSLDLHPSWLPADWPAPRRALARLGPSGHEALSAWLASVHQIDGRGLPFDTPAGIGERLAWIAGGDLRRIALTCGFLAHRSFFETPGLALEAWRQGKRIAPDLGDFALSRWSGSPVIAPSEQPMRERPLCAGRVIALRGYRLLLGCFAAEGEQVLRRARLKFPRRASAEPVAALRDERRGVVLELLHMCIVPERFPQWDWLF